jgi:hypothetical protein
MMHCFFIGVFLGVKFCASLLGTIGVRFLIRNARISAVRAEIFLLLYAQQLQICLLER